MVQELGGQDPYIQPGCPWQNPWIESFDGRFRDEAPSVFAERWRFADDYEPAVT